MTQSKISHAKALFSSLCILGLATKSKLRPAPLLVRHARGIDDGRDRNVYKKKLATVGAAATAAMPASSEDDDSLD